MVKRSSPSSPQEIERGGGRTMAEYVYHRLRNDIVRGVLAPGAPLKSDHIRAAYETGVSPLREALTRLTGERLVTAIGQCGFRVAPLSAADVMDTAETRVLIETEALRLSIERGEMPWETGLVAVAHELRRTPLPTGPGPAAELWAEVHQRFHAKLISGCGSPWLIQLADILFAQAERHRLRAVQLGERVVDRDPQAEHDQIFEAALARKSRVAVNELTRHHRMSARHVADTITKFANSAVPGSLAAAGAAQRTTSRGARVSAK